MIDSARELAAAPTIDDAAIEFEPIQLYDEPTSFSVFISEKRTSGPCCAQRGEDALQNLMHARFYNSTMGRLLSVDPSCSSAKLGLPQTWNRYAYARNNPITYTDPDGCDVYYLDKKGNHSPKLEKFCTNAQNRNSRVRAVFAAFAPGTGRDLTIRTGDPGRHTGTGMARDGVTNSGFREATPEQLRAVHDAAGGGKAGTAAAEALMNKGKQLVTSEIVLSGGATEHTKLHEVGHVEQGLLDPQAILQNSAAADDAKTVEEYQKLTC